jgi:hypothetical protein
MPGKSLSVIGELRQEGDSRDDDGTADEIARSALFTAFNEIDRATTFDAQAGLADLRRRMGRKAAPARTGRHKRSHSARHRVARIAVIGGTAACLVIAVAIVVAHIPNNISAASAGPPAHEYAEAVKKRTLVIKALAGAPIFKEENGKFTRARGHRIPEGSTIEVTCLTPAQPDQPFTAGFYKVQTDPWSGMWVAAGAMTWISPAGEPFLRQC